MIAECLRRTGNLGLIKDWILTLSEPFDSVAGDEREPDNLGQALFLISLVSDKEHPLVGKILAPDGASSGIPTIWKAAPMRRPIPYTRPSG